MTVLSKSHQRKEQEEGRNRGDGGKTEMKFSKVIPELCLEDRMK
jgi:hypothetical protein